MYSDSSPNSEWSLYKQTVIIKYFCNTLLTTSNFPVSTTIALKFIIAESLYDWPLAK